MADNITVNLNTDRRGPAGPSEPATKVADFAALSALSTSTAARFIKLADTDIEDGGLYFIPADGDGSAARQIVVANSSGAIGATLTVRRGTISSLASVVLAAGEIAVISDRGRLDSGTPTGLTVIGDGTNTVGDLPWHGVDEIIDTDGGSLIAASNADTLLLHAEGAGSTITFSEYGGGSANLPREVCARVEATGASGQATLVTLDGEFGDDIYSLTLDESGNEIQATNVANPMMVILKLFIKANGFGTNRYMITYAENVASVTSS